MSEVLKSSSIVAWHVYVSSVLDLLLSGTSHIIHPVVSQFKKQTRVLRPR